MHASPDLTLSQSRLSDLKYGGSTRPNPGIYTATVDAEKDRSYCLRHRYSDQFGRDAESGSRRFQSRIDLSPQSIQTKATVTLDKTDAGFGITRSDLEVVARIPGADQAKFDEAAQAIHLVEVNAHIFPKQDVAAFDDLHADAECGGEDRFEGGVSPQSDVSQAQTQLDQARVQRTDLDVQRTQYEHAIAVLIGKPPAAFTLAPVSSSAPRLPSIPGLMPSELLERRPDIAAIERRMASANEQIGIAQAAFYPTLSISALGGFEGTSALNWFNWPSRFWAVGPSLSQTIFDAGRRRSEKNITVAQYDGTVADYRQTVLTAMEEVENGITGLTTLERAERQANASVESAQRAFDIATDRYKGGVDTYLDVITAQQTLLTNQRQAVQIQGQQFATAVFLVKALGGGWDVTAARISREN